MKYEFSGQILEKCSNIKFHKNVSSGSRFVAYGRTDWHDQANSHFSLILWTRLKMSSNFGAEATFWTHKHVLHARRHFVSFFFDFVTTPKIQAVLNGEDRAIGDCGGNYCSLTVV
jgi:hypothetical protein